MKTFNYLARLTLVLTLCVIVLGAYVRLSDAGLGCPDWPGCYGNLLVPETSEHIGDSFRDEQSNELHRELEPEKAWKEMIHRYLASTLGFLILIMAFLAWSNRRDPDQPVVIPIVLVGLVIFQGLLGMWTVTLLLKPLVVTAHLLGGMTTMVLLTWVALASREKKVITTPVSKTGALLPLAIFGFIVLFIQIFLGGWTSSNYAALICPDFPTCQNHWWPAMDFKEGFTLWRGLGIDYEFGVLKTDARTAIHMMHRIGALITFFTLLILFLFAMRNNHGSIQKAGLLMGFFLLLQVTLGIANIAMGLPLHIAVAHNGVAALLLLSMTIFIYTVQKVRKT
ncbi:MAG: heme A synthase [Gammaproteobacteria bacterium]